MFVSTYKDTNLTTQETMKVFLYSLFIGATCAKLLIPFAENHDSLFSYQMSSKNISSLLETSGKIILQKEDNQIKFNFIDCFVNRSENLFLRPIIDRISVTPILVLDENENLQWSNESITFDIDPLFVKEVFHLSSFPKDYSVDDQYQTIAEQGVNCGFEVRKVNETTKDVSVRFYMSLKDCHNNLVEINSNEEDQVTDGFIEVLWSFDKLHIDVLTTMEFNIQLISSRNFVHSSGIVSFKKFLQRAVK